MPPVDVVGFGMVTPATVIVVDEFPRHNTGTQAKAVAEFICDDAALIATLLRGWNVNSGLIGTALGADAAGRKVANQLQALGVRGPVRLSPHVTTPFEFYFADPTGARTFAWKRDPEVLATLATADLSLLMEAGLLYVDWYDGDYILRAMDEAHRLGISVFLNIEHGHQDPDVLARYVPHATICQAVTDPAQCTGDPLAIAQTILAAGAETVLVTLGGDGCLAACGSDVFHAGVPPVSIVDGCGAGAVFSTGVIYGSLQGWDLETTVRFAIAAASLKCTVVGPQVFPLPEIQEFAARVPVSRSVD